MLPANVPVSLQSSIRWNSLPAPLLRGLPEVPLLVSTMGEWLDTAFRQEEIPPQRVDGSSDGSVTPSFVCRGWSSCCGSGSQPA